MIRSNRGIVMSPASAPCDRLRGVALNHFEKWAGNTARSGAVCTARGGTEGVRRWIDRRIEAVAADSQPLRAARRWLVETVTSWAPLAVVFSPRPVQVALPGVSGILSVHAQEVLEKEYAHVLRGSRSAGVAIERLAAEVQHYDLQIEVAEAVGRLLCDPDAGESLDWACEFREMSLAMSEYMHRQVLGITQVLPDSLAMSYSSQIALVQREFGGLSGRRERASALRAAAAAHAERNERTERPAARAHLGA
jgi:hypothetical protein